LATADFLTTLIEGLNAEAPHSLSPREIADILWLTQSPLRPTSEHPVRSSVVDPSDAKSEFELPDLSKQNKPVLPSLSQPPLSSLPPEEDPLVPFFPPAPAQSRGTPEARLLPPELLPSSSDLPGLLPLQLAQSPLLQDRLAVLRMIQPLMRQVPSPNRQWLDETATVDAYAETRLLAPVLKPMLEPCFRLLVVLDAGVSMEVWRPLALELRAILASSQAFHAVDLRCLDPSQGPGDKDWSEQPTLVLLITDAAGAHWWDGDGRMFSQLELWGRQAPLVLLNMLPINWWARTALGIAPPVSVRNTLPGCPNQQYFVEPPSRWQTLDDATGLPLPVITLEGQELAIWAAMAMGDHNMASSGVLIPEDSVRRKRLDHFLVPPQTTGDQDPAAERELAQSRWQEFQADASVQAQRLLMVMAAAPVLTLPILRLLLEAKVKDVTTPLPLAEVLVSGLLRCHPTQSSDTLPQQLQFELEPGVAKLLGERLSPADTLDVIRAVSDVLERRWNQLGTGQSFEAILTDPNTPLPEQFKKLKNGLRHFATVTAERLERLPGNAYRDFAAKLRQGAGLVPTDPFPAKQFNFEPIDFECAQLQQNPGFVELPFNTSEIQELPAQVFVFTTASLESGNKEPTYHEATRLGYQEMLPVLPTNEPPNPANGACRPQGIALPMLHIPAGHFLMGSPANEPGRLDNEGPQHKVQLQEFFLSQTPINQAQWRAVAAWKRLVHEDEELWPEELDPDPVAKLEGSERFLGEQRPVVNVSWHDAMAFCQRLRLRSGKNYTLPSEAQWEYACRAGTSTPFHFGDTISTKLANYKGIEVYGDGEKGEYRQRTTDVNWHHTNYWGLHDMHGNVWEWCADHWHSNYDFVLQNAPDDGSLWMDGVTGERAKKTMDYADVIVNGTTYRNWRITVTPTPSGYMYETAAPGQEFTGILPGLPHEAIEECLRIAKLSIDKTIEKTGNAVGTNVQSRVLRGGSWNSSPRNCRSAYRLNLHPVDRSNFIGIRVCCIPQDIILFP
jgi:formylglycine-generating enzyme required for sulfatase activity